MVAHGWVWPIARILGCALWIRSERVKAHINQLQPTSPCQSHTNTSQVSKLLSTCTHVFVCCDSVCKSLQPPYNGPYRILNRTDKYYTIDIAGCKENVSIDRLKPAHLESCDPSPSTITFLPLPLKSTTTNNLSTPLRPTTSSSTLYTSTRFGRHVHWPKRFTDYVWNTGGEGSGVVISLTIHCLFRLFSSHLMHFHLSYMLIINYKLQEFLCHALARYNCCIIACKVQFSMLRPKC